MYYNLSIRQLADVELFSCLAVRNSATMSILYLAFGEHMHTFPTIAYLFPKVKLSFILQEMEDATALRQIKIDLSRLCC